MSVTVVSCVYGDSYGRFVSQWNHAIHQLNPRPDTVIVTTDRHHEIPLAHTFVVRECTWRHPQAFYLQQAISLALTEWVWIVDIDDEPLPDALNGIDEVAEDVLMMGYVTSDGEHYVPPRMTAADVIASHGNHIAAGSAIRIDAFRKAGGFPDIAFQDWGLWRRLAAAGATFAPAQRPGYVYRKHPAARTATELTADLREQHLAEMLESEAVHA